MGERRVLFGRVSWVANKWNDIAAIPDLLDLPGLAGRTAAMVRANRPRRSALLACSSNDATNAERRRQAVAAPLVGGYARGHTAMSAHARDATGISWRGVRHAGESRRRLALRSTCRNDRLAFQWTVDDVPVSDQSWITTPNKGELLHDDGEDSRCYLARCPCSADARCHHRAPSVPRLRPYQ